MPVDLDFFQLGFWTFVFTHVRMSHEQLKAELLQARKEIERLREWESTNNTDSSQGFVVNFSYS